MKKRYLIYALTKPFAGYIAHFGTVNPNAERDGSTVNEYIERLLSENPDLRPYLYPLEGQTITEEIRETKKFDSGTETIIDQDTGDLTPLEKYRIMETAKRQAIADHLPSWSIVETVIGNISSLAEAKTFLMKLSRIVYLLAKNESE